jgi:hypothetical protein
MKTRKSITYLFRGLVLGTLMIAAIGIYFGATSSGAGDDPSSRGNQVGIAAPSSQTIEAAQAASYWIRRDEAEEMAYDELSKNFVGIAYPTGDRPLSSEPSGTWPPDTKYYLDPDYREHQVEK